MPGREGGEREKGEKRTTKEGGEKNRRKGYRYLPFTLLLLAKGKGIKKNASGGGEK